MDPYLDNWTKQVLKGVAELALLNVIAQGRRYGYEIVALLSSFGLDISIRTVYPVLNRLRKRGLIRVELQEASGGPPRKYFHLTPLGRDYLKKMRRGWEGLTEAVQQSGRPGDHDAER